MEMIKGTAHMRGKDIWPLVENGAVKLGGHRKLKLYGRLDCKSANRYLKNGTYQKNRVLFVSEAEAIENGYRPCATCLPQHYEKWQQCSAADEPYTVAVARTVEDEVVEWEKTD